MKAAVWRAGMRRYVIPQLPGDWAVASRGGGFLYQRPAGWLARCVALFNSNFSTAFQAMYVVYPLSKPTDGLAGRFQAFRPQGDIDFPYWTHPAPQTVAEAEGPMLQILDLVRGQAIPYFDRFGTVAAFSPLVEADVAHMPIDPHHQEEFFCLQVIRGDLEGALRTADAAVRAARDAREEGSDWAAAIEERVGRNAEAIRRDPASGIRIMREQAEQTRSVLGIAPDDHV